MADRMPAAPAARRSLEGGGDNKEEDPEEQGRLARQATMWLVAFILVTQAFCYYMQNTGQTYGYGHRGWEITDFALTLCKAQCWAWCMPDRYIHRHYMPAGDAGMLWARVVGGLAKGALIYAAVYAISLSIRDEDLKEYKMMRDHKERYESLVREAKDKVRAAKAGGGGGGAAAPKSKKTD